MDHHESEDQYMFENNRFVAIFIKWTQKKMFDKLKWPYVDP